METSSKSPKISPKETLKLVLKLALVVFIFWLLFHKGLVTSESIHKVFASPSLVFLMLSLMTLNFLLSTYRWRLLLHCQKADLTYKKTLVFSMIGQFFNIALPGAVSGDVVKAVYVAKKFEDKRAFIFGSILFDRVLGVTALVIVAAVSAVVSQFVNWGGQLPALLLNSIYILGFCVFLFFTYLFVSHRRDPILYFFKGLSKKYPKLDSLERIYVGVMHYRHHFSEVSRAVAISLVVHVFVVTVTFLLANILSPEPISFIALAVIVPIGMLATAIPVLPAGVGTGHAAFYGLFHLIGSTHGAEVFSWLVFIQVLMGAVGGVVYLRTKLE